MTRGIFIAGSDSSLLSAVTAEASKRVDHFVTARIPSPSGEPPENRRILPAAEGARIPLDWNPGSPLSARSLVLAAENRLGQITEAILVCTPPSIRKSAVRLNAADVDAIINDHIKGWFFLVKELAAIFTERKSGILALALSDTGSGDKDDPVDMIGPSVGASFRSFAQGLMTASFAEPYQVYGFSGGGSSENGEDHGFGSFIFKILEDGGKRDAGKWHKYGSRLSFLGR
jgi:hypothetical protein